MKEKENNIEKLKRKIEELKEEKSKLQFEMMTLKNSAERFSELFQASPFPYQSLDENGNFVIVNAKWLEEFHYKKEEVLNHKLSEFIAPDYLEKLTNDFKNFKKSGIINDLEQVIITKDKKRIYVLIDGNASYDNEGNFSHTHCILRNVTEIKKAQEELNYKKELYSNIVENNLDGMCLIDDNGKIIYWNPALEMITGIDRTDAISQSIFELFFELLSIDFTKDFTKSQIKKLFLNFINAGISPENNRFFDLSLINRITGKSNMYQFLFSLFRTSKENIICCFVRDVNDRIEAMNKQIEIEEELKQTIIEKDKFFSILAHDLKNPIIGFTELTKILSEDFTDLTMNEINELVETINKSAYYLNQLLENLLEWSRIQRGSIPFNPTNFNLKELIHETILYQKTNLELKNQKIINEIDDNIFVSGDVYMISSVVGNLISNAIKFSPTNSNIIITAKVENDFVLVTIKDFGIGIDKRNIKKLFRLDEQFINYGTANEKGTGLGLILCKEHLKRNGGEIKIKSKLGEGSEFIFTLPLCKK